jgi:hypothetical protein
VNRSASNGPDERAKAKGTVLPRAITSRCSRSADLSVSSCPIWFYVQVPLIHRCQRCSINIPRWKHLLRTHRCRQSLSIEMTQGLIRVRSGDQTLGEVHKCRVEIGTDLREGFIPPGCLCSLVHLAFSRLGRCSCALYCTHRQGARTLKASLAIGHFAVPSWIGFREGFQIESEIPTHGD